MNTLPNDPSARMAGMNDSRTTSDLKLLVTGATGFIGSRLSLHAHRLGIDVRATGRAESSVEVEHLNELRAANVPTEVGLLQDTELVRRALRGRNAVIHLAAAQHESQMPDAYFRSVNVDATSTLLEAGREAGIERFVYGSTMGVYGSAAEGILDEDTPTRPDNIYTRTKLEAETRVRGHAPYFETCVIRISETYGPGDQRLLKLFRAIDRGYFVMIGTGNNRRQSIHVSDLIRGLLIAVQHPAAAGQTFVLAGTEVMQTNEMVDTIAAAMHRKLPRLQAPLWPFVGAARVMETILPPLRIQPPLHSRRLDFFRKSFVFSTVKAHTLLGFQPEVDFHSGVVDTVRWYRARGYLQPGMTNEVADTESA